MSTKHLNSLVSELNIWVRSDSEKIDSAKLTQANADRIFQKIDNGLSPENLACDGEASRTHIRNTQAKYKGAVKELVSRGFRPSGRTYEIPQAWLALNPNQPKKD